MKKLLFVFTIALTLAIACQNKPKSEATPPDGGELSELYCSGCHAYPKPELLDSTSWHDHMLPRMGNFYGYYTEEYPRADLFEAGEGGDRVRQAGLFPEKPTLDSADWAAIQRFYLNEAPNGLRAVGRDSIQIGGHPFEVREPALRLQPPSSTFVRFNEAGGLYVGDAFTEALYVIDATGKPAGTAKTREGAVWINEGDNAYWITVMGSFSPTDAAKGIMLKLPTDGSSAPSVPISGLQRPVHAQRADINADGYEDFVICEFGKWTGALSLYWGGPDDRFERMVLDNEPGATKCYVRDLNGDGLLDIAALFAQGNERIAAFYNQGNGRFKSETLLQFSPSNGSSYFSFTDLNGDEHDDILYCAGDNADFGPVIKPYHGVYGFVNNGQNSFKKSFFLPQNGAYGAICEDFDLDGDLDIASISFFPDWVNRPEESFIYHQNQGNGTYTQHSFSEHLNGRWIVMDMADTDEDGDLDLVLGSLAFEAIPDLGQIQRWVEKGWPYVILENRTR